MINNMLPTEGIIKDKKFYFPLRVYYEDTDAGGIVYYANYLKFAERARSEFLRSLDINQQNILAEQGQGFVVRSCEIEYLTSAFLDDALIVTCEVSEMAAASAVINQEIYRGDTLLCKIKVKLVYMSLQTHRPTRICAKIMDKLSDIIKL